MKARIPFLSAMCIGITLVASACAPVPKIRQPGVQQLTWDAGAYHDPAWSPDGRYLAYARADLGPGPDLTRMEDLWSSEIYVLDLETRKVDKITNNHRYDRHPTWSPDGTRIAFDSIESSPSVPWETHIWVVNADGTGARQVSPCNCSTPVWSPSGEELLVITNSPEQGQKQISILNMTTGVLREVTNTSSQNLYTATRDPDGARIAYAKWIGRSSEIVIVNTDGRNAQRRTIEGALVKDMTWSPNGHYLTFAAHLRHPTVDEIFALDLATGEIFPLLEGKFALDFEGPAWSPDGKHIAFVYGGPAACRALYIAGVPEQFR